MAIAYPGLFAPHPHRWGGVERDYTLQLTLQLPPDDLVVNVRIVGVEDGRVVICETAEGWRTLPGGSREQGEAIVHTAARELMEEAGCVLNGSLTQVASFTVTSRTAPWRAWHPFPVSAWLVCFAPVRRVGPPTNPPDGETVVSVLTLDVDEAIDYLSSFDNGGQADLVAIVRDLALIDA